MPISLNRVKGIGPATAEKLAVVGLTTVEHLAAATPEQLADVPGFGEFRAKQVIAHACQLVSEVAPDRVEHSDAKPSSDKKRVTKSKKGKPSKKSGAKIKDAHKKGKKGKKKKGEKGEKGKLKKDKGKADKAKKDKGKKTKANKKAKKKKK